MKISQTTAFTAACYFISKSLLYRAVAVFIAMLSDSAVTASNYLAQTASMMLPYCASRNFTASAIIAFVRAGLKVFFSAVMQAFSMRSPLSETVNLNGRTLLFMLLIAPASANVMGKQVHGIADDMLTTTIMACKCKKFISPAMNTNMFENPVVQDNLKILEHYGYEVIAPACGYLACGDTGAGKMPEPETLLAYIEREAACEKDLKGKKILVTAGPTQESVDPVRYLTNHSSGKMGYAIAKAAMLRGADVTLVSGRTSIEPPMFVNLVPVVTARDMYEAVTSVSNEQDIIVKAAAVADYRPSRISEEKVKKSDGQMSIELERTDDILKFLGEHKRAGQFLCGFSMETQNVIDNSRAKLAKKNLDMVAANNVKVEGAGFQGDTNVLTLITQDEEISLPLMSKEDAAFRILDKILSLMQDSVC